MKATLPFTTRTRNKTSCDLFSFIKTSQTKLHRVDLSFLCLFRERSRSVINTNTLPAIVKTHTQHKHKSPRERKREDEVCVGDRRSGEWVGQRRHSQQHRSRPQSLWPSHHFHQNWFFAFTHHFYLCCYCFNGVFKFIIVLFMFGNVAVLFEFLWFCYLYWFCFWCLYWKLHSLHWFSA